MAKKNYIFDTISEEMAISNLINDFRNKPDSIHSSIVLLKDALPYVKSMKSKLGAKDSHYLSISTLVVRYALNGIISVINDSQNEYSECGYRDSVRKDMALRFLMDDLSLAQRAKKIMNKYDVEKNFERGYRENMDALDKLSSSNFVTTNREKLGCYICLGIIATGAVVGAIVGCLNDNFKVHESAGIGAAIGFTISIFVGNFFLVE